MINNDTFKNFLQVFDKDEKLIIDSLSRKDWYVTWAESVDNGLKAILVRPLERMRQSFNLKREVIVLFCPFSQFDMRSISGFNSVSIQEDRAEEICGILISRDPDVVKKVDGVLKNQKESRVIIPFTYEELLNNTNPDFVLQRFRERFYSRDLFGIQEALTEDRFFFGRREIIYELVDQHLSCTCSGIFGLRKTGKTSILYGLQRTLDKKKAVSVYIDCLTLHLKSWNQAVYEVISKMVKDNNIKRSVIHNRQDYDNVGDVAEFFKSDIEAVYMALKKKSILIIFDEIENISFETSPSAEWKNGQSFIMFWQTLRSVFQQLSSRKVFTYLISGTNPRCIEQASIGKTDNPIFSQFQPHYLAPFTYDQTREMVDKLGSYMGLTFDDQVVHQLVTDYGGHPMLLRQQCSFIHKRTTKVRPYTINIAEYNACKSEFYKESGGFLQYANMILTVLKDWYEYEYEMLELLAIGKNREFEEFANENPELIAHLLNYGIIGYDNTNGYYFKIEVIKLFLYKQRVKKERKTVQKASLSIFISYSHKDEEWLKELTTHLDAALHTIKTNLDIWSDKRIEAGGKWKQEISDSIEKADVALLLISTNYMASSFIRDDELPSLLKKEASGRLIVIPIHIGPSIFNRTLLSDFQSINSPDLTLGELLEQGKKSEIDRIFISLIDQILTLLT